MNVFGDCPLKGADIVIESGSMAGASFKVEGWARDIMAKGPDWASDMGNPAVLNFWLQRPDLLKDAQENMVEFMRVGLTGLYGHVGWSGCLVMPEELGIEASSPTPGECWIDGDGACTNCGADMSIDSYGDYTKYCGNCGARVRGFEE